LLPGERIKSTFLPRRITLNRNTLLDYLSKEIYPRRVNPTLKMFLLLAPSQVAVVNKKKTNCSMKKLFKRCPNVAEKRNIG
jgi:hypothetical protein